MNRKVNYNKQINKVLFILVLILGFLLCGKSANGCFRFF